MSRVVRIQTNFASGEVDPLLRARIDLAQYYNALETATNVFILPQGGAKRRDGLKFSFQLPSSAAPQNGVRLIPFEFNNSDSYMFCVTHQRIYIFRAGVLVTNINGTGNNFLAVTAITSAMLSELRHAQAADTMILTHEDLAPLKLVRGGSHSTWTVSTITFSNTPRYPFTLSVSSPSATLTPDAVSGNVKLTASGAVFASGNVGQYINNIGSFGRLRIIEFVSTTVVKAYAEVALFDVTALASGGWELETGYEDAWSASKGYPKSITFHEGRLYFGGTKSLPTTFFGSVANDFFNFDKGEGLDDRSVEATITTESLNQIVDMFSGRDLQIFTTGGEFYVPQGTSDPITPANLAVRMATRNGTKPGVPVVGLDSGTLFVQRQGKQLNELLFTDVELSYTTANVSLLSGHLLKSPTDMAIRRATSTEEADRLFIVNGTDGSITVYSLLRAQQVVAPSRVTTDGLFQAVAIDVNTAYTVVQRTINSATVFFVELFDADTHTDSAVAVSSTGATGTAAQLPATTLDVIVDGNVQSQKITNGSGVVTFDRAPASGYEIGLPFSMEIKTLPLEPRLASGSIKGFKKRVLKVNAEVFQSQAMTVNGQLVAFRKFGEDVLDTSVEPFTGVKTVGPLLGFVDEGTITVTQSVPLALTVLALDYQLSVGQ
jgi:hypothetical protein|tara:strand:+ start:1290 stop:3272 length:1983 start_codon:yes stop_codon:yes gene_type:complete